MILDKAGRTSKRQACLPAGFCQISLVFPLTLLLPLTKIRDIQKQKEKRLTRSLP
jgi:hypothetical protein